MTATYLDWTPSTAWKNYSACNCIHLQILSKELEKQLMYIVYLQAKWNDNGHQIDQPVGHFNETK